MSEQNMETAAEAKLTGPVDVFAHVVDSCTQACSCCVEAESGHADARSGHRFKKLLAMYVTMVCVSTLAIYFLEHASFLSACRTALVAAVGKTIAANWVSSFFN